MASEVEDKDNLIDNLAICIQLGLEPNRRYLIKKKTCINHTIHESERSQWNTFFSIVNPFVSAQLQTKDETTTGKYSSN